MRAFENPIPYWVRLLAVLLNNNNKSDDPPSVAPVRYGGPDAVENGHYLRIYMGHLGQKLGVIRQATIC